MWHCLIGVLKQWDGKNNSTQNSCISGNIWESKLFIFNGKQCSSFQAAAMNFQCILAGKKSCPPTILKDLGPYCTIKAVRKYKAKQV